MRGGQPDTKARARWACVFPSICRTMLRRRTKNPRMSALFSMDRLSDRVGSYAGRLGTLGDWGAQAERVRNMTYDDWVRDKVAYGTPDAVTEKLNSLGEELGLDQVMFEINFGNLIPLENQANSLRLMMEEVAPNLA